MATPQGRQGMTPQKKKEARLSSMDSRKHHKASQRSDYHKQFKNMPGPRPVSVHDTGFLAAKRSFKPSTS
jgi:hypothetical protein